MAEKKQSITRKSRRRRVWLAARILALLFAAAAAWKWTPLADQIDIATVTAWAASIRNNPARLLIILGAYLIGSLALVPVTVLIIVTALVFGPLAGCAYSFAGCLVGAGVTYAVGYFLGRDLIRQITGPKWQDVERRIDRAGIIAVATMRLLPVAPFTVVNVVSGAFQVPLWPYFLGSLLGLAPGIILINLFAHEIEIAIEKPGAGGFILLGTLIVISVLVTLWLRLKSGKDNAEEKISV
jgi:phospholipase D1/2